MKCRCERCCPDDPAPTYTRAHLISCLAERVLAIPSLEERRAWLERWKERHGRAVTEQLKGEMRAIWEARGA